MNIALLHYAAPPVVGGVESVIARQAQQFSRSGHHVIVLAGRGEKWDRKIPVLISEMFDSRHPRILALKKELDEGILPEDFEEISDQIELALKNLLAGVQVLIVHNAASLHKNLALTAAIYRISQAGSSTHIVLWHHDLAWTTPRYAAELHSGYPWDLLRENWPGVKQVTVSQERRQELSALMDIPVQQIAVVPGGLDMEDFLGLTSNTLALLENIPVEDSAPILLTPVRITRRKNLELAVSTLAALRRRMPGAVLVITGPPGAHNPANERYFQELQEMRKSYNVREALFFMAEFEHAGLPESVVADFYRLADALFFPSREEGFGIPILEAGLAGIPVFCSRIPQLEALAGQSATYFSPDEDPEDVADLIVQRLESDPVYHLRVRVRSQYTWKAIYQKQIVPLLEELSGR